MYVYSTVLYFRKYFRTEVMIRKYFRTKVRKYVVLPKVSSYVNTQLTVRAWYAYVYTYSTPEVMFYLKMFYSGSMILRRAYIQYGSTELLYVYFRIDKLYFRTFESTVVVPSKVDISVSRSKCATVLYNYT